MRLKIVAVAAVFTFTGLSMPARAQSPGALLELPGDEGEEALDEKAIAEVKAELEKVFAQMLEWDTKTKAFKVKDEMRQSLPIAPQMIEGFLNRFLENKKGAPTIRDDEQFRQMLPMLQRFMKQGRGQLERFQNMSPEERKKALEKAGGVGKMFGNPKARDGMKKLGDIMKRRGAPKAPEAPKVKPRRIMPMPKSKPKARPNRRDGDRGQDGLRKTMQQLEKRLERIEGMLRGGARDLEKRFGEMNPRMMEQLKKRLGDGELKELQELRKRLENGMDKRFGKGFGRDRGGDRGDDERPEPRFRFGEPGDRPGMLETMNDVVAGFRRLGEILTPEDWDRIKKVLDQARTKLGPEDLQDQARLLQKLQMMLDPADLERFMEIISEFLETEEGQKFEAAVERLITDFEGFMNSERGKQMEQSAKKLIERLQGMNKGEGPGKDLGKMQERLERLLGDRKGDSARPKREHRRKGGSRKGGSRKGGSREGRSREGRSRGGRRGSQARLY